MHSVLPLLSIGVQPKEKAEEKDMHALGVLPSVVGSRGGIAWDLCFHMVVHQLLLADLVRAGQGS